MYSRAGLVFYLDDIVVVVVIEEIGMPGYRMNRFLGILYVVCGFALVFLVAWEFIIRALIVLFSLLLISYGFKIQGYQTSQFVFMAHKWRSRFRS